MQKVLWFIIIFSIIVILMVIQSTLSKRKNAMLGIIIPVVLVLLFILGIISKKIDFNWRTALVFVVTLLWSLDEWFDGRKKYKKSNSGGVRQLADTNDNLNA